MDETKNVYLISQLPPFRCLMSELFILENIKHRIFSVIFRFLGNILDLFVLLEIVRNFQT